MKNNDQNSTYERHKWITTAILFNKRVYISHIYVKQPWNNVNIYEIITKYDSKNVPDVDEKHGISLIDGWILFETPTDVFEYYWWTEL